MTTIAIEFVDETEDDTLDAIELARRLAAIVRRPEPSPERPCEAAADPARS